MSPLAENKVTLRSVTSEDTEFLARLYFDTRRHEVAAWGWPEAQQETFLGMQFEAQRRSYKTGFPGATDQIVSLDGSAVGRMMVGTEAGGMRLIDIALFEPQRNRGIGTTLLRRLLEECGRQKCGLHLQVMQGNPAIRLYRRLGLVETGADAMYKQMEWNPLERS